MERTLEGVDQRRCALHANRRTLTSWCNVKIYLQWCSLEMYCCNDNHFRNKVLKIIIASCEIVIFIPKGLSRSGPWFNIKMSSYQYRKSHCGDKTILQPSYLHNGISNTGKMTPLYWIRAQNAHYIHPDIMTWTYLYIYMTLWHENIFTFTVSK